MRNHAWTLMLALTGALATLAPLPALAALAAISPDQAPMASRANDCGRTQVARLDPVLATQSMGAYPVEAMRRGQTGRVIMRAVVGKDGAANEVVVVTSSGHALLDDAAVAAVKEKWRWDGVPAECREKGAVVPVTFEWYLDQLDHQHIFLDSPFYPAQARARGEGGIGMVVVALASTNTAGRVLPNLAVAQVIVARGTGSPELDAAMRQFERGWKFYRNPDADPPSSFLPVVIEFVPHNNPVTIETLMGPPAATPPPDLTEPVTPSNLPPPSAANDCGRAAKVYLPPIMSSRAIVDIPRTRPMTVKHQSGIYITAVMTMEFPEQGAMRMRVLVDRDGKTRDVTITDSSAPPEMEKAVTSAVRDKYRWEAPPPECRDRGVMLDLDYVYTFAPPPLQIYADDPRYPAAAHERKMGGAGVVRVTFKSPDKIMGSDVLVSTGSDTLDDSMTKAVTDLILPMIKDNSQPTSVTQIFHVMFMPDYLLSPRQQAAGQSQAARSPQTP